MSFLAPNLFRCTFTSVFCRIFIILIKLEMRLRPLKKFSIAKRFSSIFAQSIYTQHYRGKFYLYKVDKRSGGKHYKIILHFKFFDKFLGTNRHAFGFQIYRKIVSAIRICLIYPRTDSMSFLQSMRLFFI